MSRLVAVAALALVAAAGGCALPEDDRPREITAEMIPFDIDPETVAPETGGPQTVVLYLVDASNELAIVERQVTDDGIEAVLRTLIAGTNQAEAAEELTTNIPPGTELLSATVADGIATVDLSGAEGGINSVQAVSLQTAYAQLVLTAVALDGIDAVQFRIDGVPRPVPTGDVPQTSGPVDASDYASLDPPPLPTTTVPRPSGGGGPD